ncbi:YceK/YidQ family lipoprotein [Gemmata sp. G18]|uniref:YceK/YidQ family lipoprotein n=1 Tax=Gemmata palustris TaxID=2822762 RepID=A0ABS5BP80_9BACT|nr:YceK/YidQ family lipoprotein [Gemmata palustris]MBP3955539.1 YceK/YidQ family lipoprotein [Gemmata palustris]
MIGRKSLAVGLVASALGGGCGTVDNLRQPTVAPVRNPDATVCRVYGGVRGDWAAMSAYPWDRVTCTADYLLVPMMGIDLFFTFVGDTFTLPYTIGTEAWRLVGNPTPHDDSVRSAPVVTGTAPLNTTPVPVAGTPAPVAGDRVIPGSAAVKPALPRQ